MMYSYHWFFLVLQCLKFKTDQAQDAKKMEKLNNIFFTLMARGPEGIIALSLLKQLICVCEFFWLPVDWVLELWYLKK